MVTVTIHEKILGEALLKLLIKIGVVRENACPTGPELVAIAEDCINTTVLTSAMHSDAQKAMPFVC